MPLVVVYVKLPLVSVTLVYAETPPALSGAVTPAVSTIVMRSSGFVFPIKAKLKVSI